MIIHSPIISGSLTFADGATFTLPDNGIYSGSFSGSLQVHEVQSSLIPDSSASYDLGSEAFPFRDLYVSSNTIKLGGIGIGAGIGGLNIKNTSDDSPAEIAAKSVTIGGLLGGVGSKKFKLNDNNKIEVRDENDDIDSIEVKEIILKDTSGNGKNTVVKNDNGKFTTQEVNDSGSVTNTDAEGSLSGSFTGSIQDAEFNGDATFNDNATFSGTTTVSGLSSLDGGIDVDGAFTVADSTGNVSTTGTLSAGNTDVATLDVSGLATFNDNVIFSGSTIFEGGTSGSWSQEGNIIVSQGSIYLSGSGTGTHYAGPDGELYEGARLYYHNGGGGSHDYTELYDKYGSFKAMKVTTADNPNSSDYNAGSFIGSSNYISIANGSGSIVSSKSTSYGSGANYQAGHQFSIDLDTGSNHFVNGVTKVATEGLGHIIPATHNTYDLGSTEKYWRDLYLSSGSLYINGIQVLSTDGTDLTFQTDAGESVKILETGNDTITLESVNGDITLTATGNGNIELDAPIQIAAGKNILSSDGNAISFANDVDLGSNDIFAANLVGVISSSAITYDGNNIDVAGNTTIQGNLTVQGTQVQLNTTTLNIEDKNLLIASGAVDSAAANGGGITIDGADATITWVSADSNIAFNTAVNIPASSLKLDGTAVTSTAAELNLLDTAVAGTIVNSKAVVYGSAGEVNATKLQVGGVDITSTPAELNLLDGVSGLVQADFTKLAAVDASAAELNYVDGVTSNIQTQLDTLSGTDIDVTLTGAVTGTGTITNLGDVSIATTATSDPTLTINGDASGTATFTNLGDATLTLTIADDSHNHTIANVDGLQTALDGKLGLSSISATDSGGDGSFSYNNTTGVFTYTGPSATDVRAHFSGGTGVTITDGSIAIGQSVGTGDGVTFASVAGGTITGTSVSVTGDVVAYASSDERLKDNIEVISNPIEKVQQLKGVTWDWNDNADELQKSLPNVGVIAQDVEKVLPQLVKDRDNGFKGVDYNKLVGLLIEAVKDQQSQIDELKSKLG